MFPTYIVDRTWKKFGFTFRLTRRGPEGMGRFGAGWNYKIGAQWNSSKYILVSLLVYELAIKREKK